MKNKLKNLTLPQLLMWLSCAAGVGLLIYSLVHISLRLPELDSFDESSSRWLKLGYIEWYHLDLIEREFIYFSYVPLVSAVLGMLMMCIFKMRKAAALWAVSAPLSLLLFTVTQRGLFDESSYITHMITAVNFMTIAAVLLVIYIITSERLLGAAALLMSVASEFYLIRFGIGELSVRRSESMGWWYAGFFTVLTLICLSYCKPPLHQEQETA